MHTLLVYGTLMDNIGQLVAALGDESMIFPVVFYTFVLISALTVMNMLIGILCEVVSAVTTTEREELTVTYVKASLREILRQGGLDQGLVHGRVRAVLVGRARARGEATWHAPSPWVARMAGCKAAVTWPERAAGRSFAL